MPNDKPQISLQAPQHDGWTEISHLGVRWQFSDAELALWDAEMEGFHFYAFHELVLPTTETIPKRMSTFVKWNRRKRKF
jgi:hypothetical protein